MRGLGHIALCASAALCCAPSASAQVVIYDDDFEVASTAAGWDFVQANGNVVPSTTQFDADYSRFLGYFDNSPNTARRSFAMPAGTTRAEVVFDFYRFDSWDDSAQWGFDRFQVEVNDGQVFSLPFSPKPPAAQGNSGTTALTGGNVDWSWVELAPAANNAVNLTDRPWYFDQPFRFTLMIDNPGPNLKLELITATNQGGTDESAGFDNVKVTAFVDPVITGTKTVETQDTSGAADFALPGNRAVYTISATNSGGAVDADSVMLIDALPPEVILDTGVPIVLADVTAPASGLSCCTAAQVSYSDTVSGPPVFGYAPVTALDPAVTHVRLTPSGTWRSGVGAPSTVELTLSTVIR